MLISLLPGGTPETDNHEHLMLILFFLVLYRLTGAIHHTHHTLAVLLEGTVVVK